MERRLRELDIDDIARGVGYFLDVTPEFLKGMGVDCAKLPARFAHIRTYATTPGWINFPQTVNRWVLTRGHWSRG